MTNEFFDDPKHPNRPKHPDFWKLVNAINRSDAYAAEDDMDMEDILTECVTVDPNSVIYMAQQRILRMGGNHMDAKLVALYIDAFSAGVFYERDSYQQ